MDACKKLLDGIDPVQAKLDARLAVRMRVGTTFEAVARAWFEHWRGPRSERHADYVMRRLEAVVFPALGGKPIADVTAPQLLAMARRLKAVVPLTSPSGRCKPVARCSDTPWFTASSSATRRRT
jgi:integrase